MVLGTVTLALCAVGLQVAQDPTPERLLREAREVNDLALAERIKTLEDARRFVNAVAVHTRMGPPADPALYEAAALAELRSLQDKAPLVSDERLARAFNRLMDELKAPQEMRINSAELHNYRDAMSTLTEVRPWVYPNAIARDNTAKVRSGSRPVEALLTMFLLQQVPENIAWARERVRSGIVFSELAVSREAHSEMNEAQLSVQELGEVETQYRRSVDRYIQKYGKARLRAVVTAIVMDLLATRESRK